MKLRMWFAVLCHDTTPTPTGRQSWQMLARSTLSL